MPPLPVLLCVVIVGCVGAATTAPSLGDYLAALPRSPPTLSSEITGRPPTDAAMDLPRCQMTAWSYSGCAAVYPEQGLQWVRYLCATADETRRAVACTRLAEYLYRGVGGPRRKELATQLLQAQCDKTPEYRYVCFSAAEVLRFDHPRLALSMARRGCDSPSLSPGGCEELLPILESPPPAQAFVIDRVVREPRNKSGPIGIASGTKCAAWIWVHPNDPSSCGARFSCGDHVLYGFDRSSIPCRGGATGAERMTTRQDGDPAFIFDGKTIELRDDETGRLGPFQLRARRAK